MQLKDLREYLTKIPVEFDEFELVNGEVGFVPKDNEEEDDVVYRVDRPIIALYIDENSKEVCLFHQSQEDVTSVLNKNGNS